MEQNLLVSIISGLILLWVAPRWKYWESRGWRAWWEDRWPHLPHVLLGGAIALVLQAVAGYNDLYLMLMGLLILCLVLVYLACLIKRDKRKQQVSSS